MGFMGFWGEYFIPFYIYLLKIGLVYIITVEHSIFIEQSTEEEENSDDI